jgi:hypothetical protein
MVSGLEQQFQVDLRTSSRKSKYLSGLSNVMILGSADVNLSPTNSDCRSGSEHMQAHVHRLSDMTLTDANARYSRCMVYSMYV